MLFGSIQFGGKLGGYKIANHSAHQLPQDLATGFDKLTEKIIGVSYEPIWYLGSQIVNGTNHLLICRQTRTDKDSTQKIVALVVNISTDGIPSIVEVIDDSDLIEGVSFDEKIKLHFENAMKGLLGVQYTPILYLGSQVVKGVNHFVITEAKIIRNGSEPYPALITFNVFQDDAALVGIEPLQ